MLLSLYPVPLYAVLAKKNTVCSISIYLRPVCPYSKAAYIGEDYPMRLPIKLEPVQAHFDCSVRYSINDSVAHQVWIKSTDTQSGGMIRLGPDRRVFAISMYHQLHCLAGLSKALATLNRTEAFDGHFGHCLNYLRQSFQCAADATEEPAVKVSTLKSQGCAPAFIRRCSNWGTLYDYISVNYLVFHEFKAANGSWSCESLHGYTHIYVT